MKLTSPWSWYPANRQWARESWFDVEPSNYRIEKHPIIPFTSNVELAIDEALKVAKTAPDFFYWDDIVTVIDKLRRPVLHRLSWPSRDQRLAAQLSACSRVAVRSALVDKLHKQGKIKHAGDVTGALRILLSRDDFRGVYLPDVFRFVGREDSEVFLPQGTPAPSKSARSLSVILNYRDKAELTLRALGSIAEQRVRGAVEVILVNNQSRVESVELIKRRAKEILPSEFSVVHLDYDLPYSHSAQCNLAVSKSKGEVIVMFNNDASLRTAGLLQDLADWALEPNVASVGARIVGEKDRLVSSGVSIFSVDKKEIAEGFGIKEIAVEPLSRVVRSTAGNSFACAAVSRDVWDRLGGLDAEQFPTQFNDADYILRSIRAGFRHLYLGHHEVYHQPGGSGGAERKDKEAIRQTRRNLCAKYPELGNFAGLSPHLTVLAAKVVLSSRVNRLALKTLKAAGRLSQISPAIGASLARNSLKARELCFGVTYEMICAIRGATPTS